MRMTIYEPEALATDWPRRRAAVVESVANAPGSSGRTNP